MSSKSNAGIESAPSRAGCRFTHWPSLGHRRRLHAVWGKHDWDGDNQWGTDRNDDNESCDTIPAPRANAKADANFLVSSYRKVSAIASTAEVSLKWT